MKIISYSIFNGGDPLLMNWYLRGLYFNLRMNRLLYPEWKTVVMISSEVIGDPPKYWYIKFLNDIFNFQLDFQQYGYVQGGRCYNMLERMTPVFAEGITHVLCRDADAITTYREACAVSDWLLSGKAVHGINDNPAHSIPLMGGMIGIDCKQFRELTGINSFEQLVEGHDLSAHGSDQDLLMKKVYPKLNGSLLISKYPARRQDNPLWESDLTCRHIGSAGVVDMELVRFFQRHDPENEKYVTFEKEFPKLFYWHG